ncbi:MAG: hypothetical protein LUI05_08870 [Oscillospiraceae bacterium]|nr:hypothetical protein [Oscillospiraceae bacterium]
MPAVYRKCEYSTRHREKKQDSKSHTADDGGGYHCFCGIAHESSPD